MKRPSSNFIVEGHFADQILIRRWNTQSAASRVQLACIRGDQGRRKRNRGASSRTAGVLFRGFRRDADGHCLIWTKHESVLRTSPPSHADLNVWVDVLSQKYIARQ